jgi:D-beta-D-heptose 7-phosphate kinase/D-beta-D-heptose 1-phosphate adenosyltransferase
VKGGEYTEEQVVGASFVKSYGGRVHLVPLTDDAGTSDIIAQIKTGAVSADIVRRDWRDE